MVDIQFGNVQKIKQIDIANKLIVICNCTHIFCELVDDDERSRCAGKDNCLCSNNVDDVTVE